MNDFSEQRKRIIRRSFSNPLTANDNDITCNMNYESPTSSNRMSAAQRSNCSKRKSDGLMCNICEAPAHGYNFNAITCESCKAFFRRNALKARGKFKCRLEHGQCVINMSTRKRCKACRLLKCFEKGMRADWILTDEERINKRLKIEENRRLRQLLYPDSVPINDDFVQIKQEQCEIFDEENENQQEEEEEEKKMISPLCIAPMKFATAGPSLTPKDLLKIQQIQQAYLDSVRLTSLPADIPCYPQTTRINATSDMMNLPANIQATRLITYFKLLPEFSSLDEQDKLLLTKFNTFPLTFIRAALNYNPLSDTYHEPNTDDCIFEGRDLIECFSLYHYERSTRCVRNLLNASLGDRFLLQVLLIIMLFSKGSSICTYIDEAEPMATDIFSICRIQNLYVDLLWKYCQRKFGTRRTEEIFLRFVVSSMDAHLQAFSIRQGCVKVAPVADQLAPLMKSVMLIS